MFDFTNPSVFLSLARLPAGDRRARDRVSAVRGETIKQISLATTAVVFFMSLCMIFGWSEVQFHAGERLPKCRTCSPSPWIPSFNIHYLMGIDGISFPLVVLTAFLSVLAMGASWPIKKHVKAYCILFLLLETGMLGVFLALDFFLFYVFWEVMLLPMYFLIGIWGGPRKEYAAIKFFLYTLVGSVLMLIAILMLYFNSDLRAANCRRRANRWPPAWSIAACDEAAQQAERQTIVSARHAASTRSTSWPCSRWASTPTCSTTPIVAGASRLQWWAFVLLFIGFVDQGAQRAAPHLVARRARRGADADLDDPGRRAAEDGRLRHHPHLLPDLPAGRLRPGVRRLRASAW